MNYGNLGHLTKDGDFLLEQDILNVFCLDDQSKIYGLYYPCPPISTDSNYRDVTIRHDFILTAIPERLWPITCRVNIPIPQKKGTVNEICKYLKGERISIVHAESSRSSYRYATWSLHVVFEKLLGQDLTYDVDNWCYKETNVALTDFLKNIQDDLGDYLFVQGSLKPEGRPNSSLSHFAYYLRENHQWVEDDTFLKSFELTLHNDKKRQVLTGDNHFKKILNILEKNEKGLFPATVFSELDTRDLNLRIVPISENSSRRFFKMKIEYYRKDKPDTGVGILHEITDNWSPSFNVWHSYNYIIQNDESLERGAMVFLIENISRFYVDGMLNIKHQKDHRSANSYMSEAKKIMDDLVKNHNSANANIEFFSPSICPLPNADVMEKIYNSKMEERIFRKFHYDLFISYSHADKKFVTDTLAPILRSHDILFWLDEKQIEYGSTIENELYSNINNCREMCVVISEKSEKRKWVITEMGAAWILNMNLVPISIKKRTSSVYFDIITGRKYVNGLNDASLHNYAEEVIGRRSKGDANIFRQLFLK